MTANVGITLAQMGKRVCVIAADLGGANLHSCLGVTQTGATLDLFVMRQSEELQELAVPTSVPNLSLISGAGHVLGAANPKYQKKMRLIRKIRAINFDHVLLDLGAGTGFNTLDFFLSGDLGVLICLPEPTSIDNLYRFVKAAFFRQLRDLDRTLGVSELVQAAMADQNADTVSTPQALFERIKRLEPERGAALHEAMQQFPPKLVVNQVRSGADADIGPHVALAARVSLERCPYQRAPVRPARPTKSRHEATTSCSRCCRRPRGLRSRTHTSAHPAFAPDALATYMLFTPEEAQAVSARVKTAFRVLGDANERGRAPTAARGVHGGGVPPGTW